MTNYNFAGHHQKGKLAEQLSYVEFEKNENASYDGFEKIQNRRAFFDRIARTYNFDPLVPHNWYIFSYGSLKYSFKVRKSPDWV